MIAVSVGDTTRKAIERAAHELYAVPGRGLLAVDSLHHRNPALPEGVRASRLPPPPTGLLVTIAHWRASGASIDSTRLRNLIECLSSVLVIDLERVIVAITTTEPEAVTADLAANADELPPGTTLELLTANKLPGSVGSGRAVRVIGWKPSGLTHRHPYHLTWAHKQLICSALADSGLSHFLYLEDDLRFTPEALSYWCRYREPLARHRLLPGFVRVESLDGELYIVDQLERVSCSELPHVPAVVPAGGADDDALCFVNLQNPYQGMYVLDRPLAIDHCFRSPARDAWRSRALVHWGIRERAAVGPTLDEVPAGFVSRNVVPVCVRPDGLCRLQTSCTVEHLTGNYTRVDNPLFGNIPVTDMFARGPVPA